MARERMITRTITNVTVNALCMNTDTCEVSRETFSIGNVETEDKILLKTTQALYETDNFKVVKIEDFEITERLFGMSEVAFMENAIELDPETRKPL